MSVVLGGSENHDISWYIVVIFQLQDVTNLYKLDLTVLKVKAFAFAINVVGIDPAENSACSLVNVFVSLPSLPLEI